MHACVSIVGWRALDPLLCCGALDPLLCCGVEGTALAWGVDTLLGVGVGGTAPLAWGWGGGHWTPCLGGGVEALLGGGVEGTGPLACVYLNLDIFVP